MWKSREILISTKLHILKSNVKAGLMIGSETWHTTKSTLQKTQSSLTATHDKTGAHMSPSRQKEKAEKWLKQWKESLVAEEDDKA